MTEDEEAVWRRVAEAEQAGRGRDLADLRSGRRTAVEINAANRVVPDGGSVELPQDLSCLELDLDECRNRTDALA